MPHDPMTHRSIYQWKAAAAAVSGRGSLVIHYLYRCFASAAAAALLVGGFPALAQNAITNQPTPPREAVLGFGTRVAAQSPTTNRPQPFRFTAQPRAVSVTPAPAQPVMDPLASLMMSQPSIDLESPVAVQAEFDPPVVMLGGRATYRLVITAVNDSIKLPDTLPAPAGLTLTLSGRGQSFQSLGTKIQPRTMINFRVNVSAIGAYTLPAFTLTAYGKPVTVPEARLTVVQPGTAGVREAPRLLMEVPEGEFFVGQAINVRVMLLDPGDGTVQGMSQVQVAGEAFLVDGTVFRQRRDVVTRNGRAYPAFVHEVTATPIREGKHTLTAQGHAIINRVLPLQPGVVPFYQPMVDADPLTVAVRSLPKEGELPGFTGAIGTFLLDLPKLSTNAVRAGDPLTLTVTVRGEGNLGRLVPPKALTLREWQMFPPTSDSAPAYLIQQRGFASFSYTLVPLTDQIKATPAIPFSYFDPKKKAYVSLTIPPVPLSVTPPPAGVVLQSRAPQAASARPSLDDSANLERELVLTGLAESPGVRASTLRPLQQRPWFLALQGVPAAALAGLWAWDRRRRYLAQHPEVVLKRHARRGLRRQLRLARQAAAARDGGGFVTAAVNALREACAPHGAANPEALVCGDVLNELPAEEHRGQAGELVRRLFAAADAIRFGSAVPNAADLLALKPDWEQLLERLNARL